MKACQEDSRLVESWGSVSGCHCWSEMVRVRIFLAVRRESSREPRGVAKEVRTILPLALRTSFRSKVEDLKLAFSFSDIVKLSALGRRCQSLYWQISRITDAAISKGDRSEIHK